MHHESFRTMRFGVFLAIVLATRGALAQDKAPAPSPSPKLSPEQLAAIDRISADSLKGHLSFLASDLLEGRDTPSKGLDLAAEYIAAQFRRAGLEAVGDDGYFQTANFEICEPNPTRYKFDVVSNGKTLSIPLDLTVGDRLTLDRLDLPPTSLYVVNLQDVAKLDLKEVAGKVVIVVPRNPDPGQGEAEAAALRSGAERLSGSKAALVVAVSHRVREPRVETTRVRLVDPKNPRPELAGKLGSPQITVYDPKLVKFLSDTPVGPNPGTVTYHGAATARPVKLRNVVGVLRGSDVVGKDTCVMVTAHYDHIGVRGAEGTDRIFNGANDDGSGTVSVIELATSLATLKERPGRSILFVAFFGEEKGLLGSRYFGRNPIFPVESIVADINLEQVGRTDDSEGPQVLKASMTGFGYSSVSTIFVQAGEAEGVKVVKHPRNSDAFFGRSDNQALADLGVPAHTLCVAFQYPDYHGAADHWDKLDYANMARIDRVVARALLTIADDPNEPVWDETNPKAAKYLKAWKDLHPK